MTVISDFKVVKNYNGFELWRNSKFLAHFTHWEDMLQYCYDLDRYLPEETLQLPMEWD